MPKEIRCARCGKQLALARKVFNREIYDVVEPHICGEVADIPFGVATLHSDAVEPPRKSPKAILDSFPFVQKLNKAKSEVERPSMRDMRPNRDEVVDSIAPMSLRDKVMAQTGNIKPVREDLAYDHEEDSVEMESGSSEGED